MIPIAATSPPLADLGNSKEQYCLYLADTALLMGQRNSEWTGHGPILEQDIALSNIALDQIGQARYLYQYAARLINERPSPSDTPPATEDRLAFLRDAPDFRNLLIAELPKGDWAFTILRQFLVSTFQSLVFDDLSRRKDPDLAAIAGKALKELTYHRRWSGEWVVRLADGTEESRRRVLQAMDQQWRYTREFFQAAEFENYLVQEAFISDPSATLPAWNALVEETFQKGDLDLPAGCPNPWIGGKQGRHTEHLGYLLAEMQFLQRAYPGCTW